MKATAKASSPRVMIAALAIFAAAVTARTTVTVQAQSQRRFEVASLKERDGTVPFFTGAMQRSPGRLISRCATLASLVFYAFRLTLSTPVEGLPGWASTPCSDAHTTDTYEFQATMPVETSEADVRLMLQAFLIDRFTLAFHWETRTLPVLALVVAPGGFKVKPTDPKDDPPRAPGSIGCPREDPTCHVIPMGSSSMKQVAEMLSSDVGRPIIDKTGLRETYYVDLKWAGDAPDSPLPSLPAVLREQFGLELKSETGPVEVLVIDRAERPTPN
jgi:uncharacterized protein (TIGR03435 family)